MSSVTSVSIATSGSVALVKLLWATAKAGIAKAKVAIPTLVLNFCLALFSLSNLAFLYICLFLWFKSIIFDSFTSRFLIILSPISFH